MSIEMENPQTLVGLIDAALNYINQIRLATAVGDRARIVLALIEAERLLTVALDKAEEAEEAEYPET